MRKLLRSPRRPVAAAVSFALATVVSRYAAGTQYDVVVLSSQGVAYGIDHGVVVGGDSTGQPTVWANNGATTTHLPVPGDYRGAAPYGVSGATEGGLGFNNADNRYHALLWNGTGSLPVDLGAGAGVNAVYGGVQVGSAGSDHASLWTGTAASLTDLNPATNVFSEATGVWGNEVSGTWHHDPTGSDPHAALWTSLSSSGFVDLTQPSFLKSDALAVSRGQVAGWAIIVSAGKHAAIWGDTAASFVDLAPAGTTGSELLGTNGTQQVGDVAFLEGGNTDAHAAVWSGTAASYQLLPSVVGKNYSRALAIDGSGDIVGEAGVQIAGAIGQFAPVMWVPHRLPGDANFDGTVNFTDLLTLAEHYGQAGEWVDGEFSGGGTVDFSDLLVLAQDYGQSADPVGHAASVPEPIGILGMSALSIMLCCCDRRRDGRANDRH